MTDQINEPSPEQIARMRRAAPLLYDAVKLTLTIFETAKLGMISREAKAFEATLQKLIGTIEGEINVH